MSYCEGLLRALSSPDSDGINQTATVSQREKLEPGKEAGRTPMREAVRKEGETCLGNHLDKSCEGGGTEEGEESKQAPDCQPGFLIKGHQVVILMICLSSKIPN